MVEMKVLHIAGVGPAAERLDKGVRHAGHAAQMDVTVGFDMAYRLVCRDKMDIFHNLDLWNGKVIHFFVILQQIESYAY